MKSAARFCLAFSALCIATAAGAVDQPDYKDRIEAAMFGLLPDSAGWTCARNVELEAKPPSTTEAPITAAAPIVIANCQFGTAKVEVRFVFDRFYASIKASRVNYMAKGRGAESIRLFENGKTRLMIGFFGLEGVLGDHIVVSAPDHRDKARAAEQTLVMDTLATVLSQRGIAVLFRPEDVAEAEAALSTKAREVRLRTLRMQDMIELPDGATLEPPGGMKSLETIPDYLSLSWLPFASKIGSIGDCKMTIAIDESPIGVTDARIANLGVSGGLRSGQTSRPIKVTRRDGYIEREVAGREIAALIDDRIFLTAIFINADLCKDKFDLLRQAFDRVAAKDFSQL